MYASGAGVGIGTGAVPGGWARASPAGNNASNNAAKRVVFIVTDTTNGNPCSDNVEIPTAGSNPGSRRVSKTPIDIGTTQEVSMSGMARSVRSRLLVVAGALVAAGAPASSAFASENIELFRFDTGLMVPHGPGMGTWGAGASLEPSSPSSTRW